MKNKVREGKLISVNSEDDIEKDGYNDEATGDNITKSLTNDSISEIVSKLEETKLAPPKGFMDSSIILPGIPVKITNSVDDGIKETEIKDDESDTTSAKESEGQDTAGNSPYLESILDFNQEQVTSERSHSLKKKKHRKKAASHDDNVDHDFESSLDLLDQQGTSKKINGHTYNEKPKHKRKSHKNKSSEKTQEAKLIDIDTPTHSPNKTVNTPNTRNRSSRLNSASKRKRSRHKIYLDDPDVHELIIDHVCLLQRYLEDESFRKSIKKEKKHHSKSKLLISKEINVYIKCMVSSKRSHILKQACSSKLQVCLCTCDLLVATRF